MDEFERFCKDYKTANFIKSIVYITLHQWCCSLPPLVSVVRWLHILVKSDDNSRSGNWQDLWQNQKIRRQHWTGQIRQEFLIFNYLATPRRKPTILFNHRWATTPARSSALIKMRNIVEEDYISNIIPYSKLVSGSAESADPFYTIKFWIPATWPPLSYWHTYPE